ncbi:MBL fold metallo-hydrolase [Microlunatus sp. GCM10028923]|uniref:MBL fold metallo-hydrolase n=1 Tax=Microlunatus sp. GCM10028923 TaxID=3273400 RepID=UPI003622372B
MSGPNHVTPGGPPVTTRLSETVTMIKLSVGPMDNNAYLLRGPGGSVLIDAANDADRLLELIGDQAPDTIVTTHRHQDHWQALSDVAEATRSQLICGRPDQDAIATGAWVEELTGVWDGDTVALGEESLTVIGLVGHTPGSIALAYRGPGGVDHLFTGDSLFPGGPGKTGSPADFASLMDDLETKIFGAYEDATEVHPGHGDDTTLGAERPQLGEWRARGW